MHNTLRPQTCGVLTVTIAILLSGCASGVENTVQGTGTPTITSTPHVRAAADISLPFDAYNLSDSEDRAVLRGYHAMLARCADRFGVHLTMPVPTNPGLAHANARRYGIIDTADVLTRGYSAPPPEEPPAWNPPTEELRVLDGVRPDGPRPPRDNTGAALPRGGCIGDAERRLGGPPPFATERLEAQANQAAEKDTRLKAAFSAWSRCMAARGHAYRSPWEPNDRRWPRPVTAAEIGTARDDLACREATNLPGVWLAVETGYQRQLLAQHRSQFAALRRWKERRITLARAGQA